MGGVRSMLARVAKLEEARATPKSPFEFAYGSFDAFEVNTKAGIETGDFCATDMPIILTCLERWHREGIWGNWQHSKIWERHG